MKILLLKPKSSLGSKILSVCATSCCSTWKPELLTCEPKEMEGIPGRLPSLWHVSAFFSSHRLHSIHPPKSRTLLPGRWDTGPAAFRPSFCAVRTSLVESPKTPLLEVSKTDQLEARRGKGLAIVFPPWRSRRRKSKGSERGDMEREGGGARQPPHFPLLSSSSPSLPLFVPPSSSAFFSLAVFLGESGRSELNRKWDTFILCVVTFGCWVKERTRAHGRTSALVCSRGGCARLPSSAFPHLYFWSRRFISDGMCV